jgi:cysteine desulfurase
VSRVYLDHASTSPPRPGVVDAMVSWLDRAADPGRVHTEGRMVRAAIEDARDAVASLVGARPRSVIFTSGATEAINFACVGASRIGCAPVEHSAVRDASSRAGSVSWIPVSSTARISTTWVPDGMDLVHCQWGNHEVGTLQPVSSVVSACRAAGVRVHVDAAQACGQVPLNFDALGADLMSISAHKFGGPPGIGALIVRRGLRIPPLLVGGSQERGRRAGMENVPAIMGFGAAAAFSPPPLFALSAALLDAALAVPGVVAYGDPVDRLPHIVCIGVPGVSAEAVLLGLDQAGIAAHSGSACSSEVLEPSPVLEAMGVDASHSLRLSVGWSTTAADVAAFAAAFPPVVARLRALGTAE